MRVDEILKSTISEGGMVLVLGWMARYHDRLTLRLEEAGLVRFVEEPPRVIAPTTLVIFTRFIKHKSTERARGQGANVFPHSFTPRAIKSHLKVLVSFLPKKTEASIVQPIKVEFVHQSVHQVGKQGEQSVKSTERSDSSEPVKKAAIAAIPPATPDPRLAFAVEFSELVKHDPHGELGKSNTAKLIRKHFGQHTRASALTDLLISEKKEGKKKIG